MYSLEDKQRAIELYIRYDKSCAAVINEIGYPCRVQLLAWYRNYKENDGKLSKNRYQRYSDEQKRVAVDHYLETRTMQWSHEKSSRVSKSRGSF